MGSLAVARESGIAALLGDGTVLVSGGQGAGFQALRSAEIYDPASGTWSPGPDMNQAREDFTATVLGTGNVLVAGPGNTAERYVPGP